MNDNSNKLYCSRCDNILSIHKINSSLPDGKDVLDLNTEEWIDFIYREFGWTLYNEDLMCPECLGY